MTRLFSIAALIVVASGTAAFAADPSAVAHVVASCCDLVAGCCAGGGMPCCP